MQVFGDKQGTEGVMPSKPQRAASQVLLMRGGLKVQLLGQHTGP